ncbi:hypothetical protein Tco_1486741 [Tanacetum coccineum]
MFPKLLNPPLLRGFPKAQSLELKLDKRNTKMHKEDHQAAGGPSSLGAARHDASADFTAADDLGISAPKDSIS